MGAGKLAVGAWESGDLAVGVRGILLLGWGALLLGRRNVVRSGIRERGQSA